MSIKETDLYQPVKQLLEGQGYEVKSEIASADIVGVRGEEPPVIVEMKTGFSLALLHQAVERLKITDLVYVAVLEWKGRSGWQAFVSNRTLCRRLGIGIITIPHKLDRAQVQLDPMPYAPRKNKAKLGRLLKEFQNRVGDPNQGGSTKTMIITSYRQDALRCLNYLNKNGPTKASEIAEHIQVKRARNIMSDDHYGWFERVERGIYGITPKGREAIIEFNIHLEALEE